MYEECEVSWITNTDPAPLTAYPALGVRGSGGLSFGTLSMLELHALLVQSGGLSGEVVRQVVNAELPKLRHMELYLGSENYGGTATADDLAPLLGGQMFPQLRVLGLRDSEYADKLAPVMAQLEVLDLSLGALGDEGAAAHCGWQRRGRVAAGEMWQEHGLVSLGSVSTYTDHSNVRQVMDRLINEAGVARIRVHDMRHTAASTMI